MNDDLVKFFSRSTHCDLAVTRRIITDIDTLTRSLRLSRRITSWGATEQPKICLYGGLPVNFGGSTPRDDRRRIIPDPDSPEAAVDETCILPIQIWLTHQYPIEPPTLYIVCNPQVKFDQQSPHQRVPIIKIMSNHPLVDITGLCFFHKLAEWSPITSTLCNLIEQFGRALEKYGICPIYVDENTEATPGASPAVDHADHENTSTDDECIVCYTKRDTVLVPCGHYCLCVSCASNVLECPICRTKIKVRQRIFN